MVKFLKKIIVIINFRLGEMRRGIHIKKIRRSSIRLRKNNKTDYNRWKKSGELLLDWDERTNILAGMIEPGSRIIEFGAGNRSLKNNLPTNCTYTASDIWARIPDYLVCDLNENIEFEITNFNTAVFSGVFEYVYDIDKVFEQLSPAIDHIILSYSCSDISNADRLNNGWLSDYSKGELECIFAKFKYKIVEYKEWRKQSLYNLKKY